MFNEGEIIKNCLYKKMEITDTIMFIPIELYNLKQTEYKLRGFCQIVEELGAKNIEIIFLTIVSLNHCLIYFRFSLQNRQLFKEDKYITYQFILDYCYGLVAELVKVCT